jgi:hypothetical protein
MSWDFLWGFIAGALSVVVVASWHVAGVVTSQKVEEMELEDDDGSDL